MAHQTPDPGRDEAAEPLLTVGAWTTLATALLAFLVAFGMDIDDDTQTAILGLVAILVPLVTAVIGRRLVWSPASVARLIGGKPPKQVGVDPVRGDKTVEQPKREF